MNFQKTSIILFYDDTCGLCDRAIHFIACHDKKKNLYFAPLQGKTAQALFASSLEGLLQLNSVVLLEENSGKKKIFIRSKAIFRSFWHLGKGWKLLGLLGFLPSWLFDALYKVIANRRKALGCPLIKKSKKEKQEQFLA